MDFDALVAEIAARVAQKLNEPEAAEASEANGKPRLLILTQEHGETCHATLESAKLREYYHTECALMQQYQCAPENYEAAVVFHLTNEALCRIADGICGTAYTALLQKLLLSGKKIFIPTEQVELYQYQQTAPAPYYAMLSQKLDFLKQAGVVICPQDKLEDMILDGSECCTGAPQEPLCPCIAPEAIPQPQVEAIEKSIDKKVISEKDMIAALTPGVTAVHVRANAILTDLAREYAKSRRIPVIRG